MAASYPVLVKARGGGIPALRARSGKSRIAPEIFLGTVPKAGERAFINRNLDGEPSIPAGKPMTVPIHGSVERGPCSYRGARIGLWTAEDRCWMCGELPEEDRTHPETGQQFFIPPAAEVRWTKDGSVRLFAKRRASSDDYVIVLLRESEGWMGAPTLAGPLLGWRCYACFSSREEGELLRLGPRWYEERCPVCKFREWSYLPVFGPFPGRVLARGSFSSNGSSAWGTTLFLVPTGKTFAVVPRGVLAATSPEVFYAHEHLRRPTLGPMFGLGVKHYRVLPDQNGRMRIFGTA